MVKRILISCTLILAAYATAQAQYDYRNTQYKVQTIYIYNFTKYITWPSEYNRGNFVIGVLGESKLISELKKMANVKSVGGRRIEVKKFNSLQEVNTHTHMLVLPTNSSDLLSQVIRQTGKGTLIITSKPGMAKVGSLINFVSIGGKPRFELNVQAVDRAGLRVSSPLKSIAIKV